LTPGLYFVDVKSAVKELLRGRLAGICKACGREFRFPNDPTGYEAFLEDFLRHPLEHDPTPAARALVTELLFELKSISPEDARRCLEALIAERLPELIDAGTLARVRHG